VRARLLRLIAEPDFARCYSKRTDTGWLKWVLIVPVPVRLDPTNQDRLTNPFTAGLAA
jgi:hypothetical protein